MYVFANLYSPCDNLYLNLVSRPVLGSAFTAYVPGKSRSPSKQFTGLDSLRSRTSFLTSLGQGGPGETER